MGTRTTTLGIPRLNGLGSVTQLEYDMEEGTTFNKHFLSDKANMCHSLNAHDSPVRWAVVTPFLAYANVRLEENGLCLHGLEVPKYGTGSQNLSSDFKTEVHHTISQNQEVNNTSKNKNKCL